MAYVLPLVQQLKQQELFEGYERRPKRPRIVILTPTRELAVQITQVIKSFSHSVKLSTQALVGGQDKGLQRKSLESRPVDIIVATPGRLIYHWKNNNIFLGNVQSVVIDEMDTMLEQGFVPDLREILYPLLYPPNTKEVTEQTDNIKNNKMNDDKPLPIKENAPQIIMTSATMTQSIQRLLGDNPKTSNLSISAKRLYRSNNVTATGAAASEGPSAAGQFSNLKLPPMKIVSAPGSAQGYTAIRTNFCRCW